MRTLFLTREAILKRHENTLRVKIGDQTRSLPIEHLEHIVALGPIRFNSALLELCGKNGVRISIFDYYGHFRGTFEPFFPNPSGEVKLRQAAAVLDEATRQALAKELIRAAVHNLLANLRYYRNRGVELKETIDRIVSLSRRIETARSSEQLMGIEGNIHSWYFQAWKAIDPQLDFTPRKRRPPDNPVNCLISFLNQLVYVIVRHEISKTHLDPTLSFLHTVGRYRHSLALDLAEPFKPILTDQLIFRLVRKGMLEENWFDQKPGICLLTETGRRHVVDLFSRKLEECYRDLPWREWIYREALAIEREVLGVEEYHAFRRRV